MVGLLAFQQVPLEFQHSEGFLAEPPVGHFVPGVLQGAFYYLVEVFHSPEVSDLTGLTVLAIYQFLAAVLAADVAN